VKGRWKRTAVEITVWLVAEIVLNLLGLDELADYSEFLFKNKVITMNHPLELTITTTAGSSWF